MQLRCNEIGNVLKFKVVENIYNLYTQNFLGNLLTIDSFFKLPLRERTPTLFISDSDLKPVYYLA